MTRPGNDDDTDDDTSEEEVELRVPLRTVCFIAELAHDLMGKTASTAAEEEIDEDDPTAEILEDRGADAVGDELRSLIDDLDEEAQVDLVALMWFGRDDDDWATYLALAEQEHTAHTADYLLGTPLISDYLLAGLNRLGIDCSEVER